MPDPYGVWDYFDKRGIPHALYFRHARDVELHNVRVAWGKVSGAWRSAVRAQSVEGLDLNGLIARQAPGPAEAPVVHLSDVRRAHLSNCRAEPGTGTFLRLDGAATEEITSFGNELGRARSAFSFGEEVGLEWRRRLEAK